MKAIKLTAREVEKQKFRRESEERLRNELSKHKSFGRNLVSLNPKKS